jgi:hypothetical protein
MAEWFSLYLGPEDPSNEPLSYIIYPIVNRLDSIDTVKNNFDVTKHKVVGTLITVLYWREIISNILPPRHNGIVVVFENPCSASFTYQIK